MFFLIEKINSASCRGAGKNNIFFLPESFSCSSWLRRRVPPVAEGVSAPRKMQLPGKIF
jgi:hypothetical protein